MGARENAASYGPKKSTVLCEARRCTWARGSGQISDDVCWRTRKGHRYIENLALKEEVDQASMIEEIAGSSEALRKSP